MSSASSPAARTPLVAGNWKMYTTADECASLCRAVRDRIDAVEGVEKAVCPPFPFLGQARAALQGSSVRLGAQNAHWEEQGAYTGEVSPLMLKDLVDYVIIGHSERRQYFNETGEIVNKKIMAALAVNLKPILCVGERLEENEAGRTAEVVTEQLESSLAGIEPATSELVIAYEPIWAIGTGRAATGEQANETISLIRRSVAKLCDNKTAQDIRILYGGSVTAANTTEVMQQPEIDGALVGGASLKANEFLSIVKQTSAIKGHS